MAPFRRTTPGAPIPPESRRLEHNGSSAAWCARSPSRCARPSTSANSTASSWGHPLQAGGPPACGGRFDRDLWRKLIDADVLSAAAPESLGGGGFGVLEQVAVLTALGRQLAAVPYLESVVLGAGALAKFGSESLQQDWAVPAINGEKILTVALDGEMGQGRCRPPPAATGTG